MVDLLQADRDLIKKNHLSGAAPPRNWLSSRNRRPGRASRQRRNNPVKKLTSRSDAAPRRRAVDPTLLLGGAEALHRVLTSRAKHFRRRAAT
jgi:hypothetical protein